MTPKSTGYVGETRGYKATDEEYKRLKDSLKAEGWNIEDHGDRGALLDKDGSIISIHGDKTKGYVVSVKDLKK